MVALIKHLNSSMQPCIGCWAVMLAQAGLHCLHRQAFNAYWSMELGTLAPTPILGCLCMSVMVWVVRRTARKDHDNTRLGQMQLLV